MAKNRLAARRTWHGASAERSLLQEFRLFQARRRYRYYAPYFLVWLVASAGFWAGFQAWENIGTNGSVEVSASSPSLSTARDNLNADFDFCHTGGGTNCVVDGDTIWVGGARIRIADIDAPETHPPRCEEEDRLGNEATTRLHELMNAGPFSLKLIDRGTDRYGRQLRIVMREGKSLGDILVAEGLARHYESGRRPWCPA